MVRLGWWLVICWLAVAVWVSDRWLWTIPALLGVMGSMRFSRMLLERKREGPLDSTLRKHVRVLLQLLMLASFAYLYLVFFIFELAAFLNPERTDPRSVIGAAVGCVLTVLILGVGAAAIFDPRTSEHLKRFWDWLLEER